MEKARISNTYEKVESELNELDKETVEVDGMSMKPSQCYRFSFDPVHVLFNINCPAALREKILSIFEKYNLKENNSGETPNPNNSEDHNL